MLRKTHVYFKIMENPTTTGTYRTSSWYFTKHFLFLQNKKKLKIISKECDRVENIVTYQSL